MEDAQMNRQLLIIGLGFVTIWDTVTTIYGTKLILGGAEIQFVIAVLFSLFLAAYLLRSVPIIRNPSPDLFPVGAKVLWFLAFLYDLFTAFKGNFDLVLGNVGGNERIALAIGLTIFICSAPIGLSRVIFEPEKD
jgi:hypothetical protein